MGFRFERLAALRLASLGEGSLLLETGFMKKPGFRFMIQGGEANVCSFVGEGVLGLHSDNLWLKGSGTTAFCVF